MTAFAASAEREALGFLDESRGAMLALLEALVNIDSPSRHLSGVAAVGECIGSFLNGFGITHDATPDPTFGDAICFRVPGREDGPHVLLMGHRDTVFPLGEASLRPFRADGARAYGPGVADMKGGLVVNAFVLAALARATTPCPLVGLFTADEEIASPSSRPVIAREAQGARAVFNSEPGRPSGNVVVGRKGGIFMNFDVQGKAAHSGSAFADGISAIEELARKITALHALTDLDRGITVNVGVVSGGRTLNTIAPDAHAEMDLRYVKASDRDPALNAVGDIVRKSFVKGTETQLSISGEFLPLEQTPESEALYELYRDCAASVGLLVDSEFSGGCADSGAAAATGAPTICGMGPVGGHSHTQQEYIEVNTLVPRAKAMALTILRITDLKRRYEPQS
jgi:glutamate carboxypeptidase